MDNIDSEILIHIIDKYNENQDIDELHYLFDLLIHTSNIKSYRNTSHTYCQITWSESSISDLTSLVNSEVS